MYMYIYIYIRYTYILNTYMFIYIYFIIYICIFNIFFVSSLKCSGKCNFLLKIFFIQDTLFLRKNLQTNRLLCN